MTRKDLDTEGWDKWKIYIINVLEEIDANIKDIKKDSILSAQRISKLESELKQQEKTCSGRHDRDKDYIYKVEKERMTLSDTESLVDKRISYFIRTEKEDLRWFIGIVISVSTVVVSTATSLIMKIWH